MPAVENGAVEAPERYGRYEIVRKIASGGMGEVFLARSVGAAGFQKFVVIKKILPHLVEQPQFVEGLVREAKLLVMLDHPNIVQVLDLGVEGKDYFMAMEFVHGYNMATIAHYCAQKRVLIPANACAAIALGVLAGLEYAHDLTTAEGQRQNIIHRDVSPQNVMISREGRVKLTDFGIAKVLNEAEGEHTQSLKGKFRYMAPEAVDGGRIDTRYDIFATGILLFEGLCRRHLFGGRNDVDILNQVREVRIPPIERYHPNVPKSLVTVTHKALARSADRRYQDASAFARELREAIKPANETDAMQELKDFIADLYERPDFPVNKPKIPDLQAVELEATRSLLLESHLPAQPGREIRGVAVPGARGGGGRVALWLMALAIVAIGGGLLYMLLVVLPGLKSEDPPLPDIYVVSPKDASTTGRTVDAEVVVSPDAAPPSADKGTTTPPPKCKARRFNQSVGLKAVQRYFVRPASRCINKHRATATAIKKLTVAWKIAKSGRVLSASLSPAGQEKTVFGRCMLKAARKVRFPCHTERSLTYRQTLSIAPK